MTYYVYENWTRNRGRIHRADCSACNNGAGIHEQDSGSNGKWHGPFADRDKAYRVAQSLDRAEMRPCLRCNP